MFGGKKLIIRIWTLILIAGLGALFVIIMMTPGMLLSCFMIKYGINMFVSLMTAASLGLINTLIGLKIMFRKRNAQ